MLPFVSDSYGPVELIGPFDWEVTGRNMTCLAGVGAFFYILTILIEYRFFVKPRYGGNSRNSPLSNPGSYWILETVLRQTQISMG